MNMKVKTIAAEEENRKLSGELLLWQNIAAVSVIVNVILTIMIAIIVVT